MRSLGLALLLLPAVSAEAQLTELLPGSRLRIESSAPSSRIEGTLMGHEGAALVVARSGALRTTVPYSSVMRIRISEGKSHATGARKGIKIGSLWGAGLTVAFLVPAIGLAGEIDGEALGILAGMVAGGAFSGAVYGVIIGGIVGAEKWTTVYDTPYKLDARR